MKGLSRDSTTDSLRDAPRKSNCGGHLREREKGAGDEEEPRRRRVSQ